MELHWLTIHEAASLIARGELSPVELTQACITRIERLDPQLNAFITRTFEQALAQAHTAQAELRRGERRGPLHGIPLALKDLYETAAVRTTAGSKVYQDHLPAHNAFSVDRLAQAGALLLGKLNLHEIALGLTNENPHFGVCHNPWDTTRISGGSSGGSAAALAAGLCPASLGTDTGGSIRLPAALCGVVGLKPTRGRVSLRGVLPLSWNLDHAGPMARCVRDAALLLQTIAGYDPHDPYCINTPLDDYLGNIAAGVQGWRIAMAADAYFQDVDAGIWQVMEAAAHLFASLGAQVERVDIPHFAEFARANSLLVTADAAAVYRQPIAERPQDFGADVLERLRSGAAHPLAEYILARRLQAEAVRQFDLLFSQFDLLLLPASPVLAPPIQQTQAVQRARQLTRFTSVFNFTGLPVISLPGGFIEQQGLPLPVGLQLVTRPWAEARLLRAAYAYEQAAGWFRKHPDLDSYIQ